MYTVLIEIDKLAHCNTTDRQCPSAAGMHRLLRLRSVLEASGTRCS